ncbi:Serine/threonine-protein kinase PknB [Rubripirellula tenax]|uniref:Serine/threonine-protein kinase PknB n=1 Tax=Rubripirellula tenax TaxID=2528015 RepID=A0A5C6F2U2_9BACT|nr:serine/threonine-protein kinase [Rubripirellula tenax]TWU54356.1 Serine/threonine-protein kinase PknB [Rubripirellula tenax]
MISLGNHHQSMDDELDDESGCIQGLTDEQKETLGELLETYLHAMETGLPPSVEQITASTPELREALRECVSGLESLHRMAAGTPQPTQPCDSSNCLGDFLLHETIGRGGMGVVYRATQVSLRRTVAVKLLPMAAVLDPRQLTRFQHEAEAAASLQHPNIVPVFAVGFERGVHFYAMRYIDGASIEDWIATYAKQDGVKTDWRTAVDFTVQVASGLQAAHEFGIIHRDIKPSNLLLDGRGKVWIADFGLARIQSDVSITGSKDVVGTIRYMSPEQARGDSAVVDGRTDIYSLAATLYEMLAKRPAHAGDDAATILRQVDEDVISPLRRIRTDIPCDLATVIAKAMASKRDDRYESASEFAADLRRVLAGESTIARPPTLTDKVVRFASNHRTAVIATALVGCLALAGFAVGTTKLAAAKNVSDALAIQSNRNQAIAREAVDRLGTQITELLADIPAANSVRHRLLSETLGYYQQMAAVAVNDVNRDGEQQRRDLAITLGKMGVLQSELGNVTEAIDSLRASEELYSELAQRSDDKTLQLQWSISQNNLAQRFTQAGDLQAAGVWFAKAIDTQSRLHCEIELAKTLNNLGSMLADAQKIDESQQTFEHAIELLESADGQEMLQSTVRSNLAGLLAKRAPERSAELASQSLRYQVALLETDPADPKLATQVMLTLNTLATSQSQMRDHASAVESLQQSVKIGQQLISRWPDQPTYRRDLIISLNQLGLSLAATHQLSQASDALRQAADHGRMLKLVFVDDAEVQNMLGGVLNNLAFLTQRIGDPETARRIYEDAIEHQRIAISLAPQMHQYHAALKTQQYNLQQLRGES